MTLGGLVGALAIAAQWISFDRTSVAIAITVQQLAALVVVGLVPLRVPRADRTSHDPPGRRRHNDAGRVCPRRTDRELGWAYGWHIGEFRIETKE